MLGNRKNKNNCNVVPSRPVMSRPSLLKMLEVVQAQVEYECFGKEMEGHGGKKWIHIDPIYKELCLVIAEMLVIPPERLVRVKSMEMEAAIVQEVYRELRHEHIERVAEKIKEQTRTINKKTPYLQTALYNILFEYDTGTINELRSNGLI